MFRLRLAGCALFKRYPLCQPWGHFSCIYFQLCESVFGFSLTPITHITAADAAGHVPIHASEWRWAWADAWRLYLHVPRGAEHRQWGLGVRHLAGHGSVRPAAWKLHQPSGWVWHLGRSRVSFQFTLRQSKKWHRQRVETAFLHVFSVLALRSYSILNCASPSSALSVGGLLFDGKFNDSLLDSLMEASSPAGLCPPMQVQEDCQPVLVLCLHSADHYYRTGNADDCCNLLFLSGDKDGLPALRVEDEAVCVSPWREDGCGVWEALGHPVLRLQRLVCCCRWITDSCCVCAFPWPPFFSGCVGRYIRSNLNMPPSLPARGGGHRDYDKDCPITVFGSTQARLVGQFHLSVFSARFDVTSEIFWVFFCPLKVKRCWKAARL